MTSPELVVESYVVWHNQNCNLIQARHFEQLHSAIRQQFGFDQRDKLEIRDGKYGFVITGDNELRANIDDKRKLYVLNISSGEKWDEDLLAEWRGLKRQINIVYKVHIHSCGRVHFGDKTCLDMSSQCPRDP